MIRARSEEIKHQKDEREGCMARMMVHKSNNGIWVIEFFDDLIIIMIY